MRVVSSFCLYQCILIICLLLYVMSHVLCLSLSSSLWLKQQLVHVGYWKEGSNLLVIAVPASRSFCNLDNNCNHNQLLKLKDNLYNHPVCKRGPVI